MLVSLRLAYFPCLFTLYEKLIYKSLDAQAPLRLLAASDRMQNSLLSPSYNMSNRRSGNIVMRLGELVAHAAKCNIVIPGNEPLSTS